MSARASLPQSSGPSLSDPLRSRLPVRRCVSDGAIRSRRALVWCRRSNISEYGSSLSSSTFVCTMLSSPISARPRCCRHALHFGPLTCKPHFHRSSLLCASLYLLLSISWISDHRLTSTSKSCQAGGSARRRGRGAPWCSTGGRALRCEGEEAEDLDGLGCEMALIATAGSLGLWHVGRGLE